MRRGVRIVAVLALLLVVSWILLDPASVLRDWLSGTVTGAAEPSPEPLSTLPTPPTCTFGDEPAPGREQADWKVTLVDTLFALPPEYVPDDLVDLSERLADVSRFAAAPGLRLRAEAAQQLREMFRDAEASRIYLEVVSAYRSFDYQRETFARWVATDGYDLAIRTSARAGHSEHQLGSAVDLRIRGGAEPWDLDDWGETPEGRWVRDNAWRFGFVLSYPPGMEQVTCYAYEPWHYRYVGAGMAEAIRSSGLTLRVYLSTFLYADP
ncbi:MAG TPA: M15 family metallopeptidase [Trueperaceae bacterium]|nr:M15 family metallopeptidase [Trueperaceae bacterium]